MSLTRCHFDGSMTEKSVVCHWDAEINSAWRFLHTRHSELVSESANLKWISPPSSSRWQAYLFRNHYSFSSHSRNNSFTHFFCHPERSRRAHSISPGQTIGRTSCFACKKLYLFLRLVPCISLAKCTLVLPGSQTSLDVPESEVRLFYCSSF